MTPDPLDDLLDRSAPETRSADARRLRGMIRSAAGETKMRRVPRLALGIGVSTLLVGVAGVAVATDGFTWAPWIERPVGAVQFTMSNGFSCELRYTPFTAGPGADKDFLREVNGVLEEWYRSADVADEAAATLPTSFAGEDLRTVRLEPGETLESLPPGEAEHRLFGQEWLAWDLAISNLEGQQLTQHGIDQADARFVGAERASQIQCNDLDGKLYRFGAGS